MFTQLKYYFSASVINSIHYVIHIQTIIRQIIGVANAKMNKLKILILLSICVITVITLSILILKRLVAEKQKFLICLVSFY